MKKILCLFLILLTFTACGSEQVKDEKITKQKTDRRLEALPPELKEWGKEKNLSYEEMMKVFDLVYSPTKLNWVIPEDKKVWVPKITRITPDMVGTIIGPHWSHNPQGVPFMAFEGPKNVPLKVRHIKTKFEPSRHAQRMKSAIENQHLKENDLNNYEELDERK